MDVFGNRVEAGKRLAARLRSLAESAPVVLGLPRGGVPVAAELAKALNAPLESRSARFRRGRERVDLTVRTAVIVDDGIATGPTARAACQVARRLGAKRVILAVPVGPLDTVERFEDADEVICLSTPPQFFAVGYHYRDFTPRTEEDVIVLLDAAEHRTRREQVAADPADRDLDVSIPVDGS